MRSIVRVSGIAAILSCSAPAYAQEATHGTGVRPVSPEQFARLPKTPTYRAFLPESVDLSSRFPTPGDQGTQGSCVGWAVGYAARAYYVGTQEGRSLQDAANIPSPAYIYDSIVDDPKNCDSGSSIINALDLLKKGALSKRDFPYRPKICSRPSAGLEARATDFRLNTWLAVEFHNLDQIKGELAKNNPVVIGMRSTKRLKRLHGREIYNAIGSANNVWHAMSVVGYDDRRQAFKVINSWGAGWGDRGFGWIAYSAFRTEVGEAYVMRPAPSRPLPTPEPTPVAIVRPAPAPSPEFKPEPMPPAPAPVSVDIGCGHVSLVDRGGQRVVTGFVGSDDDLKKLALLPQFASAKIEAEVRLWPQCELLLTLDKPLSRSDRPAVKIEAEKLDQGSHLIFSIRTPDYPSFLHVAYIQADGSVVNLVQPDSLTLKETPPNQTIRLGALGKPGPKFRVTPPFGREMLVAIASRAPLFAKPLPVKETERQFLTELRRAIVAKPDPSAPDRIVSAAYAGVITSASKLVIPVPGP